MRLVKPEPNDYRAQDDAFDQALEARDRLFLKPDQYLHFPWPSVDALIGGLAPGDVWFLAGFSGNGKTTLLLNLVYLLLETGRTVYYLGLETKPSVLRTHLACLRLGYYAGDVLSGAAKQLTDWPHMREQLVAALERQRALGQKDRFLVSSVTHVDASALRAAAHDAALSKADVFIVDHVDHLRHEGGRSPHEEATRVAHLLLDLAQQTSGRYLIATQCNNEAVKGDRLGLYQAPQPHHVYMAPGVKRQVATGMIGIYRPLVPDPAKDVLADVRSGKREAREILEPNTMGVAIMKHRYYGNREGMRAMLRMHHGRLVELDERDRFSARTGDPIA